MSSRQGVYSGTALPCWFSFRLAAGALATICPCPPGHESTKACQVQGWSRRGSEWRRSLQTGRPDGHNVCGCQGTKDQSGKAAAGKAAAPHAKFFLEGRVLLHHLWKYGIVCF